FHGGTISGSRATGASVDAGVEIDGKPVGKLSGAHADVVDGAPLYGAKPGDPVKVVASTGTEELGTIKGATVAFYPAAKQRGLIARPKHIPNDSSLHAALTKHPGKMFSWGFDLARRAGEDHGGLGDGLPYYAHVVIVVLTGF